MNKLVLKSIVLFSPLLCSFCDFQPHTPPSKEQWNEFRNLPENRKKILALETFLKERKVFNVIPVEQLLRQGTDWRQTKSRPFAIPPQEFWSNIVPTLKVIRDLILPRIGPVTVVSGFREADYNEKAGGANSSRHLLFSAVDMIPDHEIERGELKRRLLKLWENDGFDRKIGLGLYSRNRFHIDTSGFRKWEK
ncbi:peptidase M15 [Leptospira yasudae]|uniref:D-Ala-D-Ala carboxypeptidase family metallohydrolase n=1 Tax=Leptospira yasudae TaxID=2202201 RepID=UPI00108268A5|nr:D-Ala-D-Ala carboxypeptidase family metallohydrolase [Leptospira yasudae]TGK23527.1 peptidase M15 [Leptospira yasudae]TGM09158.1 peptidase M15 [Leptospira yasudae]